MELNEYEQKALASVWSDPLLRDAVIKAFFIAAASTPELPTGQLHTLLEVVSAQAEEEDELKEEA